MPSFLGAHAKASLKAAVVNAGLGQSALIFENKPSSNFLDKIFFKKSSYCGKRSTRKGTHIQDN